MYDTVNDNETFIFYYESEMKVQPIVWVFQNEQIPTIVSPCKVLQRK